MNKKLQFLILVIIVGIATFLRFWQLGNVPVSPDWDEAALGYNAYSVLKTGRDEYGTWYPLSLRSFDDYKPPLYMYLTVPSVAIFGLEVWAVRLPSAIAGVLTVIATYLFVLELGVYIGRKRYPVDQLALLSALLLAISPWHIQFSRIAFEANIGLTLNVFGLVFFLRGLRSRWLLTVSAATFALGLYAYHSERIFVPMIVVILILLFKKELCAHKIQTICAFVVGCIVVAPLIPVFTNPTTLTRLRGTSALSDSTRLLAKSVRQIEADQIRGDVLGKLLHNRRIVYATRLFEGYISHYSIRWMFLTGDNDRHHAPDTGLLYLWELPFLLCGVYLLYKYKSKMSTLLMLWMIIAPIPASPTTETPHAIRSLVFLPSLQIVVAVGLLECILWVKKHASFITNISVLIYGICVLYLIAQYMSLYFVHTNREFSKYWQYGYKEAVAYAELHKHEYDKIIVSTKLEQPHMFFLFYLKYNPVMYLAQGGTKSGGFAEDRNAFDSYMFKPLDIPEDKKMGKVLFIGTPVELSSATVIIRYLDGSEAIRILSGY